MAGCPESLQYQVSDASRRPRELAIVLSSPQSRGSLSMLHHADMIPNRDSGARPVNGPTSGPMLYCKAAGWEPPSPLVERETMQSSTVSIANENGDQ